MIKKFLALSLIVAVCYACNNNETKSTTGADTAAAKPAAADPTKNPDYAKGLALIAGADCLTCQDHTRAMFLPNFFIGSLFHHNGPQLSRHGRRQSQHKLRNRLRVGAGRVEDRDTTSGAGILSDNVDTYALFADDAQSACLVDILGQDGLFPNEDGGGVLAPILNFRIVR